MYMHAWALVLLSNKKKKKKEEKSYDSPFCLLFRLFVVLLYLFAQVCRWREQKNQKNNGR